MARHTEPIPGRRPVEIESPLASSVNQTAVADGAERSATSGRPGRRFFQAELRLHATFLVIAFLILLMSVLMRSEGTRDVFLPGFSSPLPESCTSKKLLGLACPGCGMTRAFIAISHFQFAKAWSFNRASFIVYAFIAGQLPWNAWQISRIRRGLRPAHMRWIYAVPVVMLIALLANWLAKLGGL